MHTFRPGLMVGVTTCVLFLAACNTDGVSLGAGAGSGVSIAGSGGGTNGAGSPGGGSSGSGSGGSVANAGLGNGAVMVTAAGSTIATPAILNTPATAGLTSATNGLTNSLVTTGNAVLTPVANATAPLTSALPLNANIANTSFGGAPSQPIGVSVLSNTPATGTLASANLLSAGQTAGVSLAPNALSGVTGALGTTTGTVGQAANGSLANVTALNQNVVSGSAPLVGASVLSKTQSQGSVLGVGVGAAGQPINLSLGGKTLLPAAH